LAQIVATLVDGCINAGDATLRVAHDRLLRSSQKHQELFRRLGLLADAVMAEGYRFISVPDQVAAFVLGKSTWTVLALTCHIEPPRESWRLVGLS
jgi:hypothetical protein